MAKFIGIYKGKLDDKGRLVFPSAFKNLMEGGDLRFVVKKDLFENCLVIYSYAEWEKESEELKSRLNFFNKEHNMFWRGYMKDRAVIEPDEKFGRVTIPPQLLESIQVKKEVLFCGNDHKIELWAREAYEALESDNSDFIALAGKIGLF